MIGVVGAIERIRAGRVVAILRGVDEPLRVAGELAAGGIGVVEVTLDSPGALDAIARLRAQGEVAVLAGTVRTPEQVEAAAAAGAEACVGPAFAPAVVERCLALGVPAIPAALTPSEIEAARRAGAALVKLFPAGALGPRYVEDLLKPLPDVELLCTGGVNADNAAGYLSAGAVAVGVSFRSGATAADARRLLGAVAR
jgi:2-dehydro-3-deoxyphosphogluconate aldolase/(4S)-4-hydroxy-2-oxoglutarate aldolase